MKRFRRIIEESFTGTSLVIIMRFCILNIIMETNKSMHWNEKQLKRIQLNKLFLLILACVTCGIFLIWGANYFRDRFP